MQVESLTCPTEINLCCLFLILETPPILVPGFDLPDVIRGNSHMVTGMITSYLPLQATGPVVELPQAGMGTFVTCHWSHSLCSALPKVGHVPAWCLTGHTNSGVRGKGNSGVHEKGNSGVHEKSMKTGVHEKGNSGVHGGGGGGRERERERDRELDR